MLEATVRGMDRESKRVNAIGVLTGMVGAAATARTVDAPMRSDEILDATIRLLASAYLSEDPASE
ncbi:hypothetical protein J0H58_10880 [bacterium]|nr:hypothetical protein [bacterium]